jgi:hypothetical protein
MNNYPMAIKRVFGEKKGTAKPKGAKDQSYKKKDKNKIKTKAKTVNRNLGKRQQQLAMTKATKINLDIDRNRKIGEAAPAAVSDVETMPKVEE